METLQTDSVPGSPSAYRFAKDSTTTADGVRGGERLATTTGESMEMPGAMARATESLKAVAGATDVVPKSGARRSAVSKEQAAHPEMPQGVVSRSMRPSSPQGVPPAVEGEDGVEEIERGGSRPQTIRIFCK